MLLKELIQTLKKMKVPKRYYSLKDGLWPDRFYLVYKNNIWEFYYLDERGGKNEYKSFLSENEACNYFIDWIKKWNIHGKIIK